MAYKKKIDIVWVGKTKESYLQAGIDRYIKLLKPFIELKIRTIKAEKNARSKEQILKKESERILKAAKGDFILLSERGILLDSLEFSEFLNKQNRLTFVLGGHFGMDNSVYEKARMVLSLSPLTFTHEMARLILLEQIYRSVTIIQGKEYHY